MPPTTKQQVVESAAWQVEGFLRGGISPEATSMTLRAILRKWKVKPRWRSIRLTDDAAADKDHAIPVNAIAQRLLEQRITDSGIITAILERSIACALLTATEHRSIPNELKDDMPEGWSWGGEGDDWLLARYRHTDIVVVPLHTGGPRRSGGVAGGSRKLPLGEVLSFAEAHGIGHAWRTARDAPSLPIIPNKRWELHRGRAVLFLEEHRLFEAFIATHWEHGATRRGQSDANRFRAFAQRVALA